VNCSEDFKEEYVSRIGNEQYNKQLECATCGLSGSFYIDNNKLLVDESSIIQATQNAKEMGLYNSGEDWIERSRGSRFDVDPSDFDDFDERMEKENREREERNKPHGKKAYIEKTRSATNG
jgi:hypothetical protein